MIQVYLIVPSGHSPTEHIVDVTIPYSLTESKEVHTMYFDSDWLYAHMDVNR